MNNQALGLVHQQQDLFYGQRIFAADYRYQTDLVSIARGFGFAAYDLNNADDPAAMLADALHTPGPALIHAAIDANEKVYPMVPPGGANTDMIGD